MVLMVVVVVVLNFAVLRAKISSWLSLYYSPDSPCGYCHIRGEEIQFYRG